MYGVPIQVYFFSRNKVWKEYERIQSDIFDHLLAMIPKFDLKVYQYSLVSRLPCLLADVCNIIYMVYLHALYQWG